MCLCQAPVGSAPAAQLMDWLIGYGVEEIITGECCGALTAFEENVFLVPYKALRVSLYETIALCRDQSYGYESNRKDRCRT